MALPIKSNRPDSIKYSLAEVISKTLTPTNTAGAILMTVAWRYAPNTRSAVAWGSVAAGFASAVPFGYILHNVRKRRFANIHVPEREDRPEVLSIGIASIVAGTGVMLKFGAPRQVVALIVAEGVGLATTLAITLRWKISMHVAVLSGAVSILVVVFGPRMLLLAPLIALSSWARIILKGHTPAQTIAGAVVGSAVAFAIYPRLANR